MSCVLSRSSLALVLALGFALAAPRSASADASQLCRSLTTLALAPTDVLLAPYIVPLDMYTGYNDQSDHWIPQYVGFLPGIVWLTGLQIGGAAIRVVAGAFEFIPGLITLPREKSPSALFTSQDEAEAVYNSDVGPCPIRIGTHYNTIPWG
jgi:hypothetical protein